MGAVVLSLDRRLSVLLIPALHLDICWRRQTRLPLDGRAESGRGSSTDTYACGTLWVREGLIELGYSAIDGGLVPEFQSERCWHPSRKRARNCSDNRGAEAVVRRMALGNKIIVISLVCTYLCRQAPARHKEACGSGSASFFHPLPPVCHAPPPPSPSKYSYSLPLFAIKMFATLLTVALFAVRVIAADDISLETPKFTQVLISTTQPAPQLDELSSLLPRSARKSRSSGTRELLPTTSSLSPLLTHATTLCTLLRYLEGQRDYLLIFFSLVSSFQL